MVCTVRCGRVSKVLVVFNCLQSCISPLLMVGCCFFTTSCEDDYIVCSNSVFLRSLHFLLCLSFFEWLKQRFSISTHKNDWVGSKTMVQHSVRAVSLVCSHKGNEKMQLPWGLIEVNMFVFVGPCGVLGVSGVTGVGDLWHI